MLYIDIKLYFETLEVQNIAIITIHYTCTLHVTCVTH